MPERRHLRREVVAESLSRESCEAQCLLGPLKGQAALRMPKNDVGAPGRSHLPAHCFLVGGVTENRFEKRWRFPLWLLPMRGQPKALEARERGNSLNGLTNQSALSVAPLKVGTLDKEVDQRLAINEQMDKEV